MALPSFALDPKNIDLNAIKFEFGPSKENDPTGLYRNSQATAELIQREVLGDPDKEKLLEHIRFGLTSLENDEAFKKFGQPVSFSGFMYGVRKLDEIIFSRQNIDDVSDLGKNLYTNGTIALARHLFTVSYIQKAIDSKGLNKVLGDIDILKIVVADMFLMSSELQYALIDNTKNAFKRNLGNLVGRSVVDQISEDFNCLSSVGATLFSTNSPIHYEFMETTIATLRTYYNEPKGSSFSDLSADKKAELNTIRRKISSQNFDSLCTGLRSETLSYGMIDSLLDEIRSRIKKGDQEKDATYDRDKNFIALLKKIIPPNSTLLSIDVTHTQGDLDRIGVGDLMIYVSYKSPKGETKVMPVLITEVKSETIAETDNLRLRGYYPSKKRNKDMPLEEIKTGELLKPTPDTAKKYVVNSKMPILSIRFPDFVTLSNNDSNSREVTIAIGPHTSLSKIKDLKGYLNPVEPAKNQLLSSNKELIFSMLYRLLEETYVKKEK